MATTQDRIKEGTVEGAADRIANMREETVRDGLKPTDPPVTLRTDGTPEEAPVVAEEPENLPVEQADDLEVELDAPIQEVAPTEEPEDDLFADDLADENVETQALDAPPALSKEGRDLFATLTPDLQKEVEARIKAAESGATKRVQQALAREKEVEAMAEQVLQMREEFSQKLGSVDAPALEPPDPDLADINSDMYDPDAFNVQLARYERAKLNFKKQESERQKIAEENAKVQKARQLQERQAHARKIVEYFPRWNTQEKFSAGVKGVQDFLIAEGMDAKKARQVTDPEAMKYFYMAKRYKEIKSQSGTRKTASKGSAPSGRPRTQPLASLAKAKASLKETGSMNDAVAVLSATRNRR